MTLDIITADYILSQLPQLPNEGIVAGGAIASIVYSAITGLKSEYSDVDVFRLTTNWSNQSFPDINILYYQDTRFRIINVSTVNNINYIYVHPSHKESIVNIIDTFDINCCMIGIDLSTKQLIYKPEFAAFLQTRQIEAVNFNNSKSTLFRLLKKKRQYPDAYLDIDKIIGFIAHINRGNKLTKIPSYITEDDLKSISNYVKLNNLNECIFVPLDGLKTWSWYEKHTNLVFQRLYGNGVKKYQKEQWLELLKNYTLFNTCITNDNYFLTLPKGWKTQLTKLGKFTDEHGAIVNWFSSFNLNEQIELFKFIEHLVEVEGKWIIGELEMQVHEVFDNLELVKLEITNIINSAKTRLNKVLVTPLPIERHYLECAVIELVTPLQLLDEGKYNNHCVGGYSNSLNDKHRIFSIRIDKYRFTCEFRCTKPVNTWYIVQCKAFNNTTPDKYPTIKTRIEAVISWLLLQLEETNSSKSLVF